MINRSSENFKKVLLLFEEELRKESNLYTQIEIDEEENINVNQSFNERFGDTIIFQFNTMKLFDGLECAGCTTENCTSTLEEKIEHLQNEFFEVPENFISDEFLQTHRNFLK